MDRKELIERLNPIFRDVLELDDLELNESDTCETVEGWDSLAHILLISEIEEEFSIKIPMAEIQKMKSLSNMLDFILSNAAQ